MKIYLGADHNGFDFKAQLLTRLQADGHEVVDCGDLERDQNDDFPKFASQVVSSLLGDPDDQARGILVCGSGQGMCMAANRFKGIRASLCWDREEARSARNDDDSNVLCLSSRALDLDTTIGIVQAWLNTPFAAASRFVRRLNELDQLGS
jgi:ribose 5-phosphate isomerase B